MHAGETEEWLFSDCMHVQEATSIVDLRSPTGTPIQLKAEVAPGDQMPWQAKPP